jgi:rubrerythrin
MTHFFEDLSGLSAPANRRDALRKGAGIGLAAAFASVPFLRPRRAFAQSTEGDFGILNYALTLEYLERSFYRQALGTGLIPNDVRPLFETIEFDEAQHVLFLRGQINAAGGTPVQYTDDDFDFGDFLNEYALITTLAQGLEDTGVRAYKGQAAAIANKDYLTAALQIHSVEARHAAAIRRLNGNQGWILRDQPGAPEAIAAVYGAGDAEDSASPSEDNVTQGGLDLTSALSGYTRAEITEAFDEPLGMSTVLGIAGPFISGMEGDGEED